MTIWYPYPDLVTNLYTYPDLVTNLYNYPDLVTNLYDYLEKVTIWYTYHDLVAHCFKCAQSFSEKLLGGKIHLLEQCHEILKSDYHKRNQDPRK